MTNSTLVSSFLLRLFSSFIENSMSLILMYLAHAHTHAACLLLTHEHLHSFLFIFIIITNSSQSTSPSPSTSISFIMSSTSSSVRASPRFNITCRSSRESIVPFPSWVKVFNKVYFDTQILFN